jgi:lipopolysaccharide export system permease protein
LQGGYSRFGLWPQIGLAVGLVLVVQVVVTAALRFGPAAPGGWALAYAAPAVAAGLGLALLWRATRPRPRARAPATGRLATP